MVLGENGVDEDDLQVHDETSSTLATMLLELTSPLPTAMGIIHRLDRPAYDRTFWQHKPHERRARVVDLLRHGNMVDRRHC